MSMYFALEKIGYRTWHSMHLMENGIIATSQDDDLWKPSIQAGKLHMGKLDFNLLGGLGYTATTDLPMGLYYEQLMEEFPDVKFILTSRKDPETWYKSIDTLCTAMVNKIWLNSIKSPAAARLTRYFRWMYTTFTGDESYLTRPFPFPSVDKESSIKSYLEHNRRVREIVPADRLLDFKVEDGWQPLCQFLEIKDCPMEPFPHSNSKIALSAYVASSAITGGIIVLTTTALELVIIVMLLKLMIRPRRGKNRELFARRSSRYVGRNGHSSSFMK